MDWFLLERPFAPYGYSHWAALAIFVAGTIGLVKLGRAQRNTPAARNFSRIFAVVVFVFPLPLVLYSMLPRQWDLANSLPLQLCDLAWMAAVCALWTQRAWAYALTYYWGLTLTSQALLTPALQFDFPHLEFIMFWAMHWLIVWAAIYLTWGLGQRPGWHSYRFTVAVTVIWAVSMLWFNSRFGTNYGFLNEKPPVKSLLDLLGDWPWYLASELVIGLTVWALMTWPWVRRTPD
jgi:hypothetical integral membrane protein (TIGR02206 family)